MGIAICFKLALLYFVCVAVIGRHVGTLCKKDCHMECHSFEPKRGSWPTDSRNVVSGTVKEKLITNPTIASITAPCSGFGHRNKRGDDKIQFGLMDFMHKPKPDLGNASSIARRLKCPQAVWTRIGQLFSGE